MAEKHSPRVLDSLALAYSLNGEPGKAAAVERRAIEALGDADPGLRAELEKKLERYEKAADDAGIEIEDADDVLG